MHCSTRMGDINWGLGLMVLAVMLSSSQAGQPECGLQRCVGILKRQATCSSSREFIKCAVRVTLENPACMEHTREQAQPLIHNAVKFQEENCPGGNAIDLCDHQMCLDQLTGPNRTCSSVQEGLQCTEMQILQNPDCSASVQTETRDHIQQARQYLELHCHRPAVPTPPSTTASNELPGLAPVSHRSKHAVAAYMTNTEPPVIESTICEYYRCIDVLVNQQVTCSTMRQVRLCAETHVFRSIFCPQQLKTNIRNLIQQEEQYLRCPGASNQGFGPVTPAPPPCHHQQCFRLFQAYDLPCGMAMEGVRCSKQLTQNPGCPDNIKMEAQNYVVNGEFYLRDQCEEMFPYGK